MKSDNDLRSVFDLFAGGYSPSGSRSPPDPHRCFLLEAHNLPPASVLAPALMNDLGITKPGFILVLDDYHEIHEEESITY